MKSKFTRLILALGMLCGVANAQPGQSAIHGAGDPRAQSPVPQCNFTKLYVDDTSGAIYSASGYPCVWTPLPTGTPGGSNTQIQFNNSGAFAGSAATINSSGDIATPTTVTSTSTMQGQIQDKGGQVFNIKAYGAKGDGSTDDTAAILAAWTAAAAVGGTVFCPASATTYRVSTLAITSAMSSTTFTGPQRSLAGGKGCYLQATGSGYIISNAGDNPGSSHPAIFDLHISYINFTGNGTSFGAIYLDFANWPIVDHNNFNGFAPCALSGVTPVEPCAHIIKMGASQYGNFHDNIFTGNGYAIDGQYSYTSKSAAGAYGCNDCDFTKNIFSSSLGVRTSGDTTVEKNDFEISLQVPALAQMDFSDQTVNATGFYANYVNGNYSESSSPFPDAAHPAQATNVLVRCGNPCGGLNVKNNKRMYGNSYQGKGVWIDTNLYELDISGNAFTYWETPIYMTAGKGFPGNGGLVYIGNNNYGTGTYPKLGVVQPTLTLTLTSGALTNIAFSGGTAGAYLGASVPFVQFTGGNCTVTPTAQGVVAAGTVTSYTITRAGSGCDGTLAATSVGGFMAQEVTGNAFTTLNIATKTFIHQIPGIEWADDTGFHFDNRAVTFSPYALAAADTTLDLTMANLYELASGTLTISAVSNARPAQKFSIRNRAGTLTLTNSVFNLCSGADSAIPAGATWAFDVGTGGTVRQANCATSGVLTGGNCIQANASGQLVDAGVACSGTPQFPKQVATVAPTLTSSTSTIGLNTIYTPPAAGVFRMCIPFTVTVAGTAGTYQPFANYTSDGHANTPNITNSVSLTTQWNNNGGAPCYVFYADSGVAIKWELVVGGVTGTPTVRYSVTLEQLQ